jgi:hypothetical protein
MSPQAYKMRAYPSELPCRRNSVDADAYEKSIANAEAAQAGGKQGSNARGQELGYNKRVTGARPRYSE